MRMKNSVEKAYKFRFYPTELQKIDLDKTFGCCRYIYNYFLGAKDQVWKEERVQLSYADCSSLLKYLKIQNEWLKEVSSVCLQQTLRHLDRAFQNFFGKKTQFPSYKKKNSTQSATYMKNAFRFSDGKLYLAKQEEFLDIRWSRKFQGEISSITITKDTSGRYFVSILVREEVVPHPSSKDCIGIDLGIQSLIVDDRGNKISNSSFFKKGLKRLRSLQRSLAKKVKGSKNRKKARQKVAICHAKIKDRRVDFLHKITTQLVNENQVIAVEDLSVKTMLKNKALARAISDSGFATFLRFLEYKCSWYGRQFVQVGKYFPSSKKCSSCGHCIEELGLEVRKWKCDRCLSEHDRDINAATNILSEGIRLLTAKFQVPRGARDFKPVEFA